MLLKSTFKDNASVNVSWALCLHYCMRRLTPALPGMALVLHTQGQNGLAVIAWASWAQSDV